MSKQKLKLPEIPFLARRALAIAVEENHPVSNLEELGVTQRMLNLFESHGLSKLSDILYKETKDLLELPNFGEKQLILLFESLAKYHLLEEME